MRTTLIIQAAEASRSRRVSANRTNMTGITPRNPTQLVPSPLRRLPMPMAATKVQHRSLIHSTPEVLKDPETSTISKNASATAPLPPRKCLPTTHRPSHTTPDPYTPRPPPILLPTMHVNGGPATTAPTNSPPGKNAPPMNPCVPPAPITHTTRDPPKNALLTPPRPITTKNHVSWIPTKNTPTTPIVPPSP